MKIFFFLLSSHLFILPSLAAELNDCLPPLSDVDLTASGGQSGHYALEVKQQFPEMHERGDTWPDDRLQRVFLKGLFQHYYHQFTGFCYEDNYQQYYELKQKEQMIGHYGRKIILTLLAQNSYRIKGYAGAKEPTLEQYEQVMAIVGWIKSVGDALQANEVFKTLGGDYQRMKIVIEKTGADLEKNRGANLENCEARYKNLLLLDRQNIDMVTVIFHWIKVIAEKSKLILGEYHDIGPGIPPKDHPFIQEVKTFYPDFLFFSRYRPLLRVLPKPEIEVPSPRTAEELELLLIERWGHQDSFISLCSQAHRAFSVEGVEEDYVTYTQLFDAFKTLVLADSKASEEETRIVSTILGNLVMNNIGSVANLS